MERAMSLRRLSFLIVILLLILPANSCNEQIKVVTVGDSWAYNWGDALVDELLSHGIQVDLYNKAVPGSTAQLWAQPGALLDVEALLLGNPDIQFIVLSIGGNDLLDGYLVGGYGEEVFPLIEQYTRSVINELLSYFPYLKISLNGYDFLNFEMTPECILMGETMLGGSTYDKNILFTKLTGIAQKIAADYPQVIATNLLGAMQMATGMRAPNPFLPTPASMMGEGDCIHPNYQGYRALMRRIYAGFFEPLLHPTNQNLNNAAI